MPIKSRRDLFRCAVAAAASALPIAGSSAVPFAQDTAEAQRWQALRAAAAASPPESDARRALGSFEADVLRRQDGSLETLRLQGAIAARALDDTSVAVMWYHAQFVRHFALCAQAGGVLS